MNPQVALHLALILFLPWFAILGALFWLYPRQPRTTARRVFDTLSLLAATGAFVLAMYWAQANADPVYGAMWKQVLASALGYAVFLGVLTTAFVLRRRWLLRAPGA